MQPSTPSDYRQLLTEVIKKQIVILGPDITLSKARNVKGLTVADDGTVTAVAGNPQEIIQALIDQFIQLSGLIVKKTMEPLLMLSKPETAAPQAQTTTPQTPIPAVQPIATATQPAPATSEPAAVLQPTKTDTVTTPNATPQENAPITTPVTTTPPPAPPTQPIPAKNPLAA